MTYCAVKLKEYTYELKNNLKLYPTFLLKLRLTE